MASKTEPLDSRCFRCKEHRQSQAYYNMYADRGRFSAPTMYLPHSLKLPIAFANAIHNLRHYDVGVHQANAYQAGEETNREKARNYLYDI